MFDSVRGRMVVLLVCIYMIAIAGVATANPFTGEDTPGMSPGLETESGAAAGESATGEAADTGAEAATDTGGIRRAFMRFSALLPARVQRSFNRQLSELMDGGSDAGLGTVLLIAGIALVYGLVHAALPGHRKTLLLAYFIASDSKPRHAVMAGVSTALLHSFAAAAIVLVAWFFLSVSITAAVGSATMVIQRMTAAVAITIGLLMLWPKLGLLRRSGGDNNHAHEHEHEHGENCGCSRPPGRLATWIGQGRMLPAIVLSSTFPCPGSTMILLFALAVGNLAIGLLAVGMFALGMGITLVTVCLLAVLGKHQLFEHIGGRFGHALHHGVEIVAGVAIVLFGIFWMWGGPVY